MLTDQNGDWEVFYNTKEKNIKVSEKIISEC